MGNGGEPELCPRPAVIPFWEPKEMPDGNLVAELSLPTDPRDTPHDATRGSAWPSGLWELGVGADPLSGTRGMHEGARARGDRLRASRIGRMDGLMVAIVDVQEKLGRGLFTNEDQVSKGVVMRLLRELGWDVHDPEQVASEFAVGRRGVDYALLSNPSEPVVLIEVKSVGKLKVKGEEQLFDYCAQWGVPLAVLTDGRTWSFYLPGSRNSDARRPFAVARLAGNEVESARVLRRYLGFGPVVSGESRADAAADSQAHLQQLAAEHSARGMPPSSPAAVRRVLSGECSFVLFGTARSFGSNRSMMLALLEELASRDPAFCANYAQVRADVKRRREDFSESGRRYAHVLPGGWWVRHGGSVVGQRRRVSAACQAAGITYGRDLVVCLRGEDPKARG